LNYQAGTTPATFARGAMHLLIGKAAADAGPEERRLAWGSVSIG